MGSEKLLVRVGFILLLIVACSQIYFFISLHNLKASGASNAFSGAPLPPSTMAVGTSSEAADIAVGDYPVAYQGYITQLQSGQMQVKTPEKTLTFSLSSD